MGQFWSLGIRLSMMLACLLLSSLSLFVGGLHLPGQDNQDVQFEYIPLTAMAIDDESALDEEKRAPYQFGIGKREPYGFGIGKRTPYEFRSRKAGTIRIR